MTLDLNIIRDIYYSRDEERLMNIRLKCIDPFEVQLLTSALRYLRKADRKDRTYKKSPTIIVKEDKVVVSFK